MSVRVIPHSIRDRIMEERGFALSQIPGYQPGDVPTHYVPAVYACSSMVGPVGESLKTMADYAATLPEAERQAAFRVDVAPTRTMREGNEADKGFGNHPLLLIHSDVIGALLVAGKLVRDDLDRGVSCAIVPGKGKKDPDGCYHIKGFASKLADSPFGNVQGR